MTAQPNGLISARFRFAFGGKEQTNTLHFIPPDPSWGRDQVRELLTILGQWWELGDFIWPAPSSYQCAAITLVEQFFSYISPVGPPFLKFLETTAKHVVGTGPGLGIPADSSVRLRFDTSGPFNRPAGGLHFCGIASSYLTGTQQDEIQGAWADTLASTFMALPAFLTDAFAPDPPPIWVVWLQRRQVGGPLAMPVVQRVTRVTVPSRRVGSMRLRLKGQHKYRAGRT